MDKLQDLLDKIYNDGVKKSESKSDEIVKRAHEEADEIVKRAHEEADEIVKESKRQAEQNELQANSSIRQVARDVIISLEDDIMNRLRNCIHDTVCDSMDVKFMQDILEKIISIYTQNREGGTIDLSVVFSPQDVDKMVNFFTNELKNNFRINPEILDNEDIDSGLKINFKEDNFYLDYSSNVLTDIICNFLEPKFSNILNKINKK